MKNFSILCLFVLVLFSCKIDTTAPVVSDNVSFKDVTYNSLTVEWQAASDETTKSDKLLYKVVSSEVPLLKDVLIKGDVLAAADWQLMTSLNISGLKTGTIYYVYVLVKDEKQNISIYPEMKTATCKSVVDGDLIPPVCSNDLKLELLDLNNIYVTFSKASDNLTIQNELKYKAILTDTNISDYSIVQLNNIKNIEWSEYLGVYNYWNLKLNTDFYFVTLVIDKAGLIGKSNVICKKTFTDDVFPTPGNNGKIECPEATLNCKSLKLEWTLASDNRTKPIEIGYKVYQSLTSISNLEQIDFPTTKLIMDYAVNSSSFVVDNLEVDTDYYFNVIAIDESSNRSPYQGIKVKTKNDTVKPEFVGGLTLSLPIYNKIIVEFNKATDNCTITEELKYKLIVEKTNLSNVSESDLDIKYTAFKDWSGYQTEYVCSSLDLAADYYFAVLVKDKSGNISKLTGAKRTDAKTPYVVTAQDVDTFPVGSGYADNLGPWLTIDREPTTSIVISYATERMKTPANLYFADNIEFKNKVTVPSPQKFEVHHVRIENLRPDTTYYYKLDIDTISIINNNATDNIYKAGMVLSFKTQPVSEAGRKFAIIGDMQPRANDDGSFKMNQIVAKALRSKIDEANGFSLVAQVGDVCEMSAPTTDWTSTITSFPTFASKVPFLSAIGNHDRDNVSQFKSVLAYNYASTETNDAFYSLDFGKAHLVFFDSQGSRGAYNGEITDSEKTWVTNDLELAKQRGQKWIFMFFHLAMFCNGADPDMGMKTTSIQIAKGPVLQEFIIPLAAKYKIDAIFWGHDHLYEHWKYYYGKNGYFYKNDKAKISASDYPILLYEIGGGGAVSEASWSLNESNDKSRTVHHNETKTFFSVKNNSTGKVPANQYFWMNNTFFNDALTKIGPDAASLNDTAYSKLFYHFPFEKDQVTQNLKYSVDPKISYSTDNEFFGYEYGEVAPHYMQVEFSADGNSCTISAMYPNGTMLGDRPGILPEKAKQTVTFNAKSR